MPVADQSKLARVDDAAARDRAVAGEVLGRRMHDQRRPHLDRAAEIGRGRGIVDDERQPGLVGHFGKCGDVGDIAAGIGDGFTEERAGVAVDGGRDRVEVVGVDEARRPTEAFDRLAELGDRAAVKPGRDDHVAAPDPSAGRAP